MVIADANGNIIFRSNGGGFEATKVTTDVLVIDGVEIDVLIIFDVKNVLKIYVSYDSYEEEYDIDIFLHEDNYINLCYKL